MGLFHCPGCLRAGHGAGAGRTRCRSYHSFAGTRLQGYALASAAFYLAAGRHGHAPFRGGRGLVRGNRGGFHAWALAFRGG